MGRIKVAIEIKSGWGSDEKALDVLIKQIKQYHLEDSVVFYCFSLWALEYLKTKLPKSTTIVICWKGFSNSIIQFPLNKPFHSLWKWRIFVSPKKLNLINVLAKPAKKSEKGIIKQIKHTTSLNKLHFAGRVKNEKQFRWLIEHGARGAMVWADAEKIIRWVSEPSA